MDLSTLRIKPPPIYWQPATSCGVAAFTGSLVGTSTFEPVSMEP